MMETAFSFVIILTLILLNGMFVAAEFAIIGVRPTRIEQLADEGSATARRLNAILKDQRRVDRYIASAQLGITLASLGLGMYGEPVIAHLLEGPLHNDFGLESEVIHTISFFVALTVITYLHVVIGEMVPKSLALQNAERMIFALAAPMALVNTLLAYPIVALNKIGMLVLRLLRVPPPSHTSRLHTPEELELIISESAHGGLIEYEEQTLIRNIFDLSQLNVRHIMVPRTRILAVPLEASKDELLDKLFTSPHSRLPVYQGDLDHILGVVHLKDIIHQHLSPAPFDLAALMHDALFVPETLPAETLLARFKKARVHMAIVIDEYGGTAGLVTLEDLIEEVTGEIRDEFDLEEPVPIRVVRPGHLVAQGSVRLDEIAEYVKLGENKFETDTIGGLVLTQLAGPPVPGTEIILNDVTLRVEKVSGMTVESVSLHFPAHNAAGHPGEMT